MDQKSEIEKLKAEIAAIAKRTASKNAYADKLEREISEKEKIFAGMKAKEAKLIAEILRRKAELGLK